MARSNSLLGVFSKPTLSEKHVTSREVQHYLSYSANVEKCSDKTYKNRKWILEPFFKRLGIENLQEITKDDVDTLFSIRGREIKESSLSVERQVVKSFFAFCADYKKIRLAFDYQEIQRKKPVYGRIEVFTAEQVGKVLTSVEHRQDKLMIALLFETGMRIGEVANLEMKDISGLKIRIRGKGNVDRLVYMSQKLSDEIQIHTIGLKAHHKVFRPLQAHYNHRNDCYATGTIRERIQREFNNVGIKMKPHQLRHSFAVNWLTKGGDIRSLQIMMGHANIETTMTYLHLSDKHIEDSYSKINGTSVLT